MGGGAEGNGIVHEAFLVLHSLGVGHGDSAMLSSCVNASDTVIQSHHLWQPNSLLKSAPYVGLSRQLWV